MREYCVSVLVSVVHFFIFLIVQILATVIHPGMGMLVIWIFVMSWISFAMEWKRKCKILERKMEGMVDVDKIITRDYCIPLVRDNGPDGINLEEWNPEEGDEL